ncbi:CDP-glucose 4,6-dehydratase/CDP-paratose 2-epimerase [Rhizobium subbaraonis]|uniref:CDP-glucose 4,6-dehydratase/CDP-paratose 2-epimerase n=1 Tax=Rhizobium subbaraonis TaxID=908946 RepID=A0A285U1Z2_9HYPH|nr:NAD(P)-dependent oxidoreductase [Rhizobium subbaraonis]SOC35733.1 CDP-glucose 4,6-dehydratase/CDP-paratose 2-epimerase [Rhizobium subbaraonis]
MSVLVTGASGFVGSWLTRALADDGYRVVAQMRRPPSTLFNRLGLDAQPLVEVVIDHDIAEVARRCRPETLFHLAGMSQVGYARENPLLAFETNARQTWQLLDVVRNMPVSPRTVVASTDALYGETGHAPATEAHALDALGPYEVSKLMADAAARAYAQFGLPVVVARLGNVYGYGDENQARILPGTLDAIRHGRAPRLRGGGRAVRSLLHVDDCIAALRLLAEHAAEPGVRGEAFNVSGEPAMTTHAIARLTLDVFGRDDLEPEISDDAPGETSRRFSSSARLRETLGWNQKISMTEGLSRIKKAMEAE